MQTRRKGQFCFVLTLSPRLYAFLNKAIFDSRLKSNNSYCSSITFRWSHNLHVTLPFDMKMAWRTHRTLVQGASRTTESFSGAEFKSSQGREGFVFFLCGIVKSFQARICVTKASLDTVCERRNNKSEKTKVFHTRLIPRIAIKLFPFSHSFCLEWRKGTFRYLWRHIVKIGLLAPQLYI